MKIGYIIKIFLLLLVFSLSAQTVNCQQKNGNGDFNFKICELKLSDKHSYLFNKITLNEKSSLITDTIKLKKSKNKTLPSAQKTKIHPVRLSLLLGGMFTGWLGMHIYYSQTWWKNRAHYFKFDEDPYYGRNVDKLSHVYTANLISTSSAILFGWTGLNPTLSMALGATTAIAYETYIEINDGFSPDWGFDWGDMAGNFIGALYPVAQHYVKPLQTLNIKWSFKPSWLDKKIKKLPGPSG